MVFEQLDFPIKKKKRRTLTVTFQHIQNLTQNEPKPIQLLEEDIGEVGMIINFLYRTQRA